MKLIHLTAKRFESVTADNAYILNLAKEFNKALRDDYLLIAASAEPGQLNGINHLNLNIGKLLKTGVLSFWQTYIYYFFWMPFFIIKTKNNSSDTVFFSNDSDLLWILIFWKKILFSKLKICSDWHMLYRNWKDRLVSRNSDYLITTSNKLKTQIINISDISEDKIKAIYGGVNIDRYKNIDKSEARKSTNLPQDKFLIGYIGLYKTMGMEKGIRTMIEALRYLDEKNIMVFVGAKPGQAEEYKNHASRIGVKDRCIFIDVQPEERIPDFEQAMDVLAIPYPDEPHFRDFGFPMKVYEYIASRRPIIYSKLDLVEEVIGDCAFGFKAGDANDLSKVINLLSTNDQGKSEIAFNKVAAYTWQNKIKIILDFIKLKI